MQANHSDTEKERDLAEMANELLLIEVPEDLQKNLAPSPQAAEPLYTSGLCPSPTCSPGKEPNAGRNRGPY